MLVLCTAKVAQSAAYPKHKVWLEKVVLPPVKNNRR
jgi:hypothetical protein